MSDLSSLVAAHPIRAKPYDEIRFTRVNGQGIPLYRVGEESRELGARNALRAAFERFGGRCFHCGKRMTGQALSPHCTRDHLRPRKDGGGDYLHNLVFACGPCNRKKGGADLIGFNVERGAEYLRTLDEHIARCITAIGGGDPSGPVAGR